jgi:nucleoside-diphosphate-sugar epimerase
MPNVVMITGAGGFIGRRVVHSATQFLPQAQLRLVAHARPLPNRRSVNATVVAANLAAPSTLHGLCDGVDLLFHCASRIGGTHEECAAVNTLGTQALMAEARRAGVPRIVYLSTASVYGRGIFRNARVEDLKPAPSSATSRSRAEAERAVLAAGGVVARPYLVYGTGDRWVVPTLLRLLRTLPAEARQWPANLSLIDVDDLSRAIVSIGLAPAAHLTGNVYHANHPQPVRCSDLLAALRAVADLPKSDMTLGHEQDHQRLQHSGESVHALDMIATDHWFDSTPLWKDTSCDPGYGFNERFPRHIEWYRHRSNSG